MNKEHKKRIVNIAVLTLVLLISGAFAFSNFNQRVLNDRDGDNTFVGGRVHDYYNRDTGNKDVFVENYSEHPIMVRIRLAEYMEIKKRGETAVKPLVPNTSRSNIESWTIWKPSLNDINVRADNDNSNYFEHYTDLYFGWKEGNNNTPWYLRTFNRDPQSNITAAAGHARDYVIGGGATDANTDGRTHPGDGTDGYWNHRVGPGFTIGFFVENNEDWIIGDVPLNPTRGVLPEDRPSMTLHNWENELPDEEKIGNFWVVDHETGWAYWASQLHRGRATSYFLDEAKRGVLSKDVSLVRYYYAIDVQSELIGLGNFRFKDEPTEGYGGGVGKLLKGIRNNAVDKADDNPDSDVDSHVNDFNFETMNPGRIFTMAGHEFRYLENMGEGNHLIILNDTLRYTTFNAQEERLESWYEKELNSEIKTIVAPVAQSFPSDGVTQVEAELDTMHFRAQTLPPAVAADETKLVPNGIERAFALSLADVNRLSGPGLGFRNLSERSLFTTIGWWWLRTTGAPHTAWQVATGADHVALRNPGGNLTGHPPRHLGAVDSGGVRPALIIHQAL